ncbi:MAG: glycosyltransferase family 2 protein [Archaeoglobi archaeon]|jgi:cellulose synthase/poly-beta-1,6-N-acetylglucosamine synthase-like glycosyltransferase|nr:glycosyltransferase family 2 protein [Archaeoglobi archaeon]
MTLAIVVPVSPFEEPSVLEESIKHVKKLKAEKIVYVIDKNAENDERVEMARKMGVEVVARASRRGKRAGAINDAIKYLSEFRPEFVLIMDVDTRTDEKTVNACISALLANPDAYIASARRYIYNAKNLPSETVEAEYRLINFLLSKSAFKQFNGMIGVLRYDILCKGLNEDAMAEDADFATRMHAIGFKALLVEGEILEQAPLSWKDFYNQRKRWYFGGLQLWKYRKEIKRAERNFRISWYLALTITYVPIIMLPLLPLSIPLILAYYRRISKLKVFLGLIIYTFVLQASAISAFLDYIRKREVEWNAIKRA